MSTDNQMDRLEPVDSAKTKIPKQVYLILGNEICERFSYYGIHTILIIYLASVFNMKNDSAVAIYHSFNMLCYCSPLLGAIVSDSYLGRYKTILYISIVYAVGNIILSVTSIPTLARTMGLYGPLVGLFLIAIGTGGIKPCVSAFGADQFPPQSKQAIEVYFSMFYFCINFGSLISMILTPILRNDIQCFGSDCYFAAFGLPAILIVLSIILFVCGTNKYIKKKPTSNIIVQVCKASWFAARKYPSNKQNVSHWLDSAKTNYPETLVEDIKSLFRVIVLFLPLPIFWTLFDQQGSRWTIQALEMNGYIPNIGVIKPDQMQALNPILVMIFIPIFESIIYPLVRKLKFNLKPLRKMVAGMLLTALSFAIASYLQYKMEGLSTVASSPPRGTMNIRVLNLLNEPVTILSDDPKFPNSTMVYSKEASPFHPLHIKSNKSLNIMLMDEIFRNVGHQKMTFQPKKYDLVENNCYTLVLFGNATNHTANLFLDDTNGSGDSASVRFLAYLENNTKPIQKIDIKIGSKNRIELEKESFNPIEKTNQVFRNYHKISTKNHELNVNGIALGNIRLFKGGVYTVVIDFDSKNKPSSFHIINDVDPRPISILWQIPQYICITAGEVLFAVTGLDFAYAESPESMKTCVMAAWLLTVSLGNLIVVILAGISITENMAFEFFAFSCLLIITSCIFALMAYYYIPKNLQKLHDKESTVSRIDSQPDQNNSLELENSSNDLLSPVELLNTKKTD